ncbi:MAG: hypothetical protein Q4A65_00095 [Bacillota bacterium]|nr:hypothetical protein [Bacillota bacterium]
MKKKNSIFHLTIAAVLSLCMVFAFAGCGSKTASSDDGVSEETTAEETVATQEAADYNISEGLDVAESGDSAVLKGNGFELTMPNTGTWSYTANGEDSVTVYYMPAESAGFGGELVTIMAMNMDDTSYEEFPDYAIAGESESLGKRFIAMFPTDLQCDPEDETQSAEYPELLDHVKKISMGAADSPFTVK